MSKLVMLLALAAMAIKGADTAAPATKSQHDNPETDSRWFLRVGLLGAIYHSSAIIATNGVIVPGATAEASNNVTLTFGGGYNFTRNIFASLLLGIPPKPSVTGEGTIAALGKLGSVRYGPAVLSVCYRVRRWGAFQPYAGPGLAYALILSNYDGTVTGLHVRNNFGSVLQAGAEYSVRTRWAVFLDLKEIWVGLDSHGLVGPSVATAHLTLNPTVLSAGIKYEFGNH